jgi:hypothetical protein
MYTVAFCYIYCALLACVLTVVALARFFYPLPPKVLRIRDILVQIWIRIRIRGSVPLTNGSESGSDPGSCYRQ